MIVRSAIVRVAIAVAILVSAGVATRLVSPDCVAACSCVQPDPISRYAGRPDLAIVTGTVTAIGADQRGTFHIDRIYSGSVDGADVRIQGGDGANCGLPMKAGQSLVMVASTGDGTLAPSICLPWADLSSPEGAKYVAILESEVGQGKVPSGTTTSATDAGPRWLIDLALAVGGLAVLVVGAAALGSFISGRRG